MESLSNGFQKLRKRKFVKFGLPFFILIIGGSFAMQDLTSIRYKFRNESTITPDEAEKFGIEMKKPGEVTLEGEYEKVKMINIEHWENKRGPRPWEQNISGK